MIAFTAAQRDIDETTGRLSPTHLQMLWDNSEFVGPGDVRDLVSEVRRLRTGWLPAEARRIPRRLFYFATRMPDSARVGRTSRRCPEQR